jgi:putative restriction endonuclease
MYFHEHYVEYACGKSIFTTKMSPTYDDLPEERYHFPEMYLDSVKAALDDWILHYEPRRIRADLSSSGGRKAYFATAQLDRIESDLIREKYRYGFVSNYTEFDNPVPFADGDFYYEEKLKKENGSTNKRAFGPSVRNIPDKEYDVILLAGFADVPGNKPRLRASPDIAETQIIIPASFAEASQTSYSAEIPSAIDRRILGQLVKRPLETKLFLLRSKAPTVILAR